MRGKRVKLQVWDTAGQERFRVITQAYYRGAMGILLVYDVTSTKSWSNVRNWVRNIEGNAPQTVNKMLIANKCDMEAMRQVATAAARAARLLVQVPCRPCACTFPCLAYDPSPAPPLVR